MYLPRWMGRLSIQTKFYGVVSIFSFAILLLLLLSSVAMDVLSTGRAYVQGEGLWSKSQKNAVYYLGKYLSSQDENDYFGFSSFLQIPLASREARLELEKDHPNFAKAQQSLIEGRNHPDDVRAMAHLFKYLRGVSFIEQALKYWAAADAELDHLQTLASLIHQDSSEKRLTPQRKRTYLQQIDQVNLRLTEMEDQFSFTLGMATRKLRSLFIQITVATTTMVLMIGLLMGYLFSRRVLEQVERLRQGTFRIEKGDFTQRLLVSSDDEIGQLAHAFNNTTDGFVRAMDELKDSHQQLLKTISGEIAHEINNPLTIIELNTTHLSALSQRNQLTEEKIEKITTTISSTIERISKVISGLEVYEPSKNQERKIS